MLFASMLNAACLTFSSATQRYFIVANRWWETVLLLLVAFSLFRPDVYRDWFYPPFELQPAGDVQKVLSQLEAGHNMRLRVEIDDKGKIDEQTFILPVIKGPVDKRLELVGLVTQTDGDRLEIVDVGIDSPAEKARMKAACKNRILGIETRLPQPDKIWFTLPAWVLLALVVIAQRRRKALAAV